MRLAIPRPVPRPGAPLGMALLAALAVAGCTPRVGGTLVGPELARCEVAEGSRCDGTIQLAFDTFLVRHPDQPPAVRAVAYPKVLPGGVIPVGGSATVVELELADGSRRVYVVTCNVGVRLGCFVDQG